MQVFEVGTATMMAARAPSNRFSELMKEQRRGLSIQILSAGDHRLLARPPGHMLSFPFNSSSMVMWVNLDALKKADIATPPKTWPTCSPPPRSCTATSPTCAFPQPGVPGA